MEITNPINAEITDGQTTEIVHMNRLHHHAQPQHDSAQPKNIPHNPWAPPQIDHHVVTVPLLRLIIPNAIDNHMTGYSCKAWDKFSKEGAYVV